MPADTQANDLWHGIVTVPCADLAAASRRVVVLGGGIVSRAALGTSDAGAVRELVRDVDGHRALLTPTAASR